MNITMEMLVSIATVITFIGGGIKFIITRQDQAIKDLEDSLQNSIKGAHKRLNVMNDVVARKDDFVLLRADLKEWKSDIVHQLERFCQMKCRLDD